jgi:hypothetical protein
VGVVNALAIALSAVLALVLLRVRLVPYYLVATWQPVRLLGALSVVLSVG